MAQSQPIRSKIYSLSQPTLDCTSFILSSILVRSSSTIWINDPTTPSGIILAGFLNATLLGIVNHYAKTDEKTSLTYKTVLAVVTSAVTAFTTPYLAIPLKDRFAVILSKKAALQIGGINLGVKALTYIFYLLGSRFAPYKIPNTLEEIETLPFSKIQEYHTFFRSLKGIMEWLTLPKDIRWAYSHVFFQNNLFFNPSASEATSFDTAFLQCNTKEEASWLYKILLANLKSDHVSKEVLKAYVALFFVHDFPPFPKTDDQKERITSEDFTLPVQEFCNNIGRLTKNQILWCSLFISNNSLNWKMFSLEQQYALNKQFEKNGLHRWCLAPKSTNDIICSSEAVIKSLDSNINKWPTRWLSFSLDCQKALNDKFSEFNLNTYFLHPQSIQDVDGLPEGMVSIYCKAFKEKACVLCKFSDEVMTAFNKRFHALKPISATDDP